MEVLVNEMVCIWLEKFYPVSFLVVFDTKKLVSPILNFFLPELEVNVTSLLERKFIPPSFGCEV